MKKDRSLSSAALHIIAMFFMLCDHTWSMLFPSAQWLTMIGRLAFPIFAFMIVEGYFHTHNIKKYLLRMLIWAVISEIPFNMMYEGSVMYPYHQNVMFTFLISLLLVLAIDTVKKKTTGWKKYVFTGLVAAAAALFGFIIGMATFVDYYGFGILTVLAFYIFHGKKWWCYIGQFAALYWINVELQGGLVFPVEILGHDFEIVQQGIAVLALIPIWLYRGRQGYHSKWFQYFCYAFYPGHMLILYLIGWLMTH